MGCTNSKVNDSAPQQDVQNARPSRPFQLNEIVSESNAQMDMKIVEGMHNQLLTNQDLFILNQLLFTIMFFENYKEEIRQNSKRIMGAKQIFHHPKLLSEQKTRSIRPDSLLSTISKHVVYRPTHGAKKLMSETIAPQRIYLINDLIEILEAGNDAHYDSVDTPGYKFYIENTKKKGFVKFAYIEDKINKDKNPENYYSLNEQEAGPSTKPDDVYLEITEMRTPQPIQINSEASRGSLLPSYCFRVKKIQKTDSIKQANKISDVSEDDLFENKKYLSSTGYMKYFRNSMFPNGLGKNLGFIYQDIKNSKSIPGKVFCEEQIDSNRIEPWEIMPAVSIDWPTTHAYDFETRDERTYHRNIHTGESYTWPTEKTIEQIKSMKAIAIPRGAVTKREKNVDYPIEWEICFPKAEELLESQMSHAQIRCYCILLSIHKTFIEPTTRQQGLLPEHIRTHIFWQIEENIKAWPELNLANKLIELINKLIVRLRTRNLPDFFIKQKNLFQDIPNQYLDFAHQKFHEILQLPLVHFLAVVRNLRYQKSGDFYPAINLNKLRSIMTTTGKDIKGKSHSSQPQQNFEKLDDDNKWKLAYQEKYRQNKLKREQANLTEENAENNDETKRDSVDSIDLNHNLPPMGTSNNIEMVTLFIVNLIGIIKKSEKLSTPQQTILYCKNVHYLTDILVKIAPSSEEVANKYKDEIKKFEETARVKLSKTRPNKKPRPPSVLSIPHADSMHQNLNEKFADLPPLNNPYTDYTQTLKKQPHKTNKQPLSVKFNKPNINNRTPSPTTPTRNVRFD